MDWGPATIEEAAAEWRDTVSAGRADGRALGDRYREVVYEQLLADPRSGVTGLFAWLGLDLPQELLDRILLEASSRFNVDPASPGVAKEKWREEMPARDVATVERVAGEQLTASGYALAGGRAGLSSRTVDVRALARRARRARRAPSAGSAAVDRFVARRIRRELLRNHDVATRFDDLLAAGDDRAVLELVPRSARVRFADDGHVSEGRGPDAARRMLAALADHRARGLRPLTGQSHLATDATTTVGTYELEDGSRWTRTLVVHVHRGAITEVAVYRGPLTGGAAG
jgi:hypothetical protein